ncbi:MAG: phosphate acyltransferase [Candidatus Eiseniibacteriota bacterium]
MSSILEHWKDNARRLPRRLLFAEAGDQRVRQAARVLSAERLAHVGLITPPGGGPDRDELQVLSGSGVRLIDGGGAGEISRTERALSEARGERLTSAERARIASDPLFQAAARVRDGEADCLVAGASRTSADVLRAALWLIGLAPGATLVSSCFVMVVPVAAGAAPRTLVFADCGVVPDPDARQLAEIGVQAAEHFERLVGEAPRVAFLSFSTHGSAEHARVEKVREAVRLARAARPGLAIDGELQADAALDLEVARRKAEGSPVAGRANVLVFPDLDSGNIGYKLVQRLAGAAAYGPILMGLRAQANDLSRGCSTDDIVQVSLIACTLASRPREPGRP